MSNVIHKEETRGRADHGWLRSRHTFNFADYFRPDRMSFGALRVLNDDEVDAGRGFMTHPHKNMEIVSIPLSGALRHKDSTGREEVIRSGEVQIMSAGTGIAHSEMNASDAEAVSFLQIWILPKELNIPPRYQQAVFAKEERKNRFQLVVSPSEEGGALWINQDARFSLASLEAGKEAVYEVRQSGNGAYVFLIEGEATVEGEPLRRRDAAGFTQKSEIRVKAAKESEVLVIEVPMKI